MIGKEHNEFAGFGISVTFEGPVFYYFDNNKISLREFVDIERLAFLETRDRRYRLFKLYDTENMSITIIGLN